MTQDLIKFLETSYTAYQAVENAKSLLLKKGFTELSERESWTLKQGGKYFVIRNGSSLIAFTVNGNERVFKIAASHTDSPALKIKENPVVNKGAYATLNVEKYGGGIMYSFFDRPLTIAGRLIVETQDGVIVSEPYVSDKLFTVPSVAIHQNRNANEGFSVNAQTDMQPLFSLTDAGVPEFPKSLTDKKVLAYDLYLVPAEKPYTFGLNDEFLAAPRIDNLTSVYASLEALTALDGGAFYGISVAACFDNEEVGSQTLQGAGGDFLERTLKRIAYAFNWNEEEYYKALAGSLLVSVDNAHAMHPNHPEKCDPTNKPVLGGGVVIKAHANMAYTTDAMTSATLKLLFNAQCVKYQTFFNRSDVASGRTLGGVSLGKISIASVDIGLPQLAMHSACECFAAKDYEQMWSALFFFYTANLAISEGKMEIK